ncbi:hypothetical protein EW146_g2618 [Bondarzewia mesenterica]|uniref:Uncharacterized protein n=1 Tax=Bondarzewia mesenterica TaxID=1095465 RepID=A0A4S4M1Y8_9AGAM|nr:hypothetical protein EW146_g2618 [Bondarzewia mesenterica]
MLSFAESEIVALCIESVTYGFYLLLFAACLNILFGRRKENAMNVRLLAATCMLFCLITWHIVIDAVRVVLAFRSSDLVAGADLYYSDVKSVGSVMKTAVYVTITAVSDAFILYRCFVVWNGMLTVVAFPALLFLADVGTGIAAVIALTKLNPSQNFYVKEQARITETFFATTLAVNGLCTALIAYRVWASQRLFASQNKEMKPFSGFSRIIVIVVESGAIYSTTLILVVATYVTQSTPAFNVFLDITSPIIGVAFSMIIVRVGLGVSPDDSRSLVSSMAFAQNYKSTKRSTTSTGMASTTVAGSLAVRPEDSFQMRAKPSQSTASESNPDILGMQKDDEFSLQDATQKITFANSHIVA